MMLRSLINVLKLKREKEDSAAAMEKARDKLMAVLDKAQECITRSEIRPDCPRRRCTD